MTSKKTNNNNSRKRSNQLDSSELDLAAKRNFFSSII